MESILFLNPKIFVTNDEFVWNKAETLNKMNDQ